MQAFAILLENTYIEYKNEINKTKYFNNEDNNKDNSQQILKEQEQIIHNIIPVYKTNIYGYYNKESVFLKIECYNPNDIKHLMYVLSQGLINNNIYQCFDAHISYSTHFFGDYKLFGMGTIRINNFSVREIIQNKNCDVDFNNKLTFFQNNIKWEKQLNNNENNVNEQEITKEEIINFLIKIMIL